MGDPAKRDIRRGAKKERYMRALTAKVVHPTGSKVHSDKLTWRRRPAGPARVREKALFEKALL